MITDYRQYLVDRFINDKTIAKYVFGANAVTRQVAQKVAGIIGVIDEYTKNDTFEGIPIVHRLEDIDKEAYILNCVYSAHAVTAQIRLEKYFVNTIDVFSLIKFSGINVNIEHYSGFDNYYRDNQKAFDEIFERLSDEESKTIFQRLVDFRLNHNLSALNTFKYDLEGQYFEPFLKLKEEGETFVDVGGYDGYTSLQFIRHCPQYRKIFLLEPGANFMEEAKDSLAQYKNIEYFTIAASEEKGELFFNLNASCSSISDQGTIRIQADKIDNLVKGDVSYIKMDVEGSEVSAIAGAVETIRRCHPRLAISIYHNPNDYISIPQQILNICDDYKLYVRHYTEGVNDSVMYFVPTSIID